MVVWEDTKLASPHNYGTCWLLVGTLTSKEMGGTPR